MRKGGLPTSPLRRDSFDHSPSRSAWTLKTRLSRRFRTHGLILIVFIFLISFYFINGVSQPSSGSPYIRYEAIDWSRFAYSQYATSSAYLCNAVMIFDALERLGSRAERILFYPDVWDTEVASSTDRDSQLLVLARDKYRVQLMPIQLPAIKQDKENPNSWDYSITKLLTFSQTQYDRVIHIDSDATLQQNIDDLFLLPPVPAAMARAYWDYPDTQMLTSLLIVIEPSYREYKTLTDAIQPLLYDQIVVNSSYQHRYDIDLLNKRYADSALVLPHRQYGLITGEFRRKDHRKYLGNDYEEWDPNKALREAKLVHFSDWPLPKPWVMWPQALLADMLPKCDYKPGTPEESGCQDREVWKQLYQDFRRRRKEICKLLSYPAPDWPPRSPSEDSKT